MSLAKSVLIGCVGIWRSLSKDLRTVVMLCVQHTHEAKSGGAIQVAGIEEDGWHVDTTLELLEQRKGSVHREKGSRPHDEDDIAKRVWGLGHPCCDKAYERGVIRQYGVD